MLTKFTYKRLSWIDIESPTKEEVRQIVDSYGIHALAAEELLGETVRPKVDYYGDQIFLALHFPTINHTHNGKSHQEIDFIIGKNFLITTHYETVDSLLEFSKMFEVNSILERSNMGEHAGFLFFYIMRELYKNLVSELNMVTKELADIENRIFSGEEAATVKKISNLNRKLINFKQAIRYHKDVLASFETAAKDLFGEKFAFYGSAISGEYYEIANLLDGHKEMLNDLWNTNDSLLTSKTNETMKTLTAMATILLPASVLASLFSMNMNFVPFINDPFGFFYVGAIVAMVAFTMYLVAKRNKWL